MATHTAPAPAHTRNTRGVQLWAWSTLAFFVIVVLEGAVVRATSSGAGCGDHWPLCNGEVLPHFQRVATIIEFLHRSLTGISSTMFFALVGWTFVSTPKRHRARSAALWSLGLLIMEALLGAVLVKGHYVENNASAARVFVQGIHFTNTMLLLAATTVLAVLLGNSPRSAERAAQLRKPLLLTLIATLVTGATGSVAALADTIFPSPTLKAALAADFAAHSPLLIRMRWMHPAASLLAILGSLVLVRVLRAAGDTRMASLITLNLLLQIVIGVLDVVFLAPTWIQVLHLFSADLFWISLCALIPSVFLPAANSEQA